MRVGILGSGLMGGKLGTIWARAGHEVVFSYARSTEKLKRLAQDAGGKARHGTPREAVQEPRLGAEHREEALPLSVLELQGDLETLDRDGRLKPDVGAPVDDAERALARDRLDSKLPINGGSDPAKRIELPHVAMSHRAGAYPYGSAAQSDLAIVLRASRESRPMRPPL